MWTLEKLKQFDVLKILEKGRSTYIAMDCIEGKLLIDIIQSEEIHQINDFSSWIFSICGELHSYHKSRKTVFGEVNPYTIVIDERQKAHLLDLQAVSNEHIKECVSRNIIQNRFMPDKLSSIKNKYHADYFGLAKTIQFILSKVQFEPYFSNKQIKKIKRTISNCINSQTNVKYQNFKDLQQEFSIKTNGKKKPKWGVLVLVLLAIAFVTYFI